MAASKSITLGTNLYPNNTDTNELGKLDARWIIYGDVTGNADTAYTADSATSADHLKVKLDTTSTAYLIGTTVKVTDNVTATSVSAVSDTGIYLTTTPGELSAKSYNINDGTSSKITLQWNSTDQSLDFIFA